MSMRCGLAVSAGGKGWPAAVQGQGYIYVDRRSAGVSAVTFLHSAPDHNTMPHSDPDHCTQSICIEGLFAGNSK